jgi:hypothetical protein
MRLNPLRQRSSGERAFDLCVLPTALAYGIALLGGLLALLGRHTVKHAPSDPDLETWLSAAPWFIWLPFGCGILFAIYWLWVLCSVMRSWTDPVVRVLRFCSLALLLAQLLAIVSLLSSPVVPVTPSEESATEDAGLR